MVPNGNRVTTRGSHCIRDPAGPCNVQSANVNLLLIAPYCVHPTPNCVQGHGLQTHGLHIQGAALPLTAFTLRGRVNAVRGNKKKVDISCVYRNPTPNCLHPTPNPSG